MFNLEQSLAEWRRQMLAAGIKTPAPLEELESHLREEFERQIQLGIGGPQAFEMAVRQIGQAQELKPEFAKNRFSWAKIGITTKEQDLKWALITPLFASFLFPCLIGGLVFFEKGCFSEMNSGERISGLAALAAFFSLIWCGRLGHRFFPVVRSRRIKDVIGVSAGAFLLLWFVIFSYLILPRYDFTVGQLMVAVLWAFIAPVGAFGGLTCGIEERAKKTEMPAS
jgi:hypothetical protein